MMKAEAMPEAYENEKKEIGEWEVEDAIRDFLRVEKHKANSELMAKVAEKAKEQKIALEALARPAKSLKELREKAEEIEED